MVRATRDALSDRTICFLVGLVVLSVCLVLMFVLKHEEEKPNSPQALVVAAFNQIFAVQEWKPGMGNQPLVYHPAAFSGPDWKPLPERTPNPWPQGQAQGGSLNWTPMNQGGGQPYGAVRP